jgi:hypothetical protein
MLSQGPFSYNRFDELDQKFPGIFESKDEEKCDECGKKSCECDDDKDDDKKGSKKNKKRPNFWQDSDGDGKWYEKGEDVKEEYIEEKKKGRCWTGYEPTPGKKPYSPGSCQKEEVIAFLMDEGYANNEVSAEVLYDHMSDEWLDAIGSSIEEGAMPYPREKVERKSKNLWQRAGRATAQGPHRATENPMDLDRRRRAMGAKTKLSNVGSSEGLGFKKSEGGRHVPGPFEGR